MYIYESHLGGLYTSDEYEDCPCCEQCGDSDSLIGEFDTAIEFLQCYAHAIDCNDGYGGYDIEHILEIIGEFEDCPSKEDAVKIVLDARPADIDDE